MLSSPAVAAHIRSIKNNDGDGIVRYKVVLTNGLAVSIIRVMWLEEDEPLYELLALDDRRCFEKLTITELYSVIATLASE